MKKIQLNIVNRKKKFKTKKICRNMWTMIVNGSRIHVVENIMFTVLTFRTYSISGFNILSRSNPSLYTTFSCSMALLREGVRVGVSE